MKRWHSQLGFVAMVAMCALTSAQAATITMTIDGESQTVPAYVNVDGKVVIGSPSDPEVEFVTAGGRIERFSGMLDPDPFITFAAAVTDPGAPSTFSFTFILPLAPQPTNPTRIFDSLSGSVTNGAAAGGVTVTAVSPPFGIPVDGDGVPEIQVFTLSDDGGVTWKNVGLDAGPTTPTPLGAFGSGFYGAYNQGYIPTIPGGPWTHMRADVNFMLSGGGDIFTFNGAKSLVPEPGTFMLSLLAIMAACACGRRTAR